MKWQRTYWPFVYDCRGEEASPKVWDVSLKSLFMLLPNMKAESLVQVQTKRVKWAVRTWKWWVKWCLSEGNGVFPHREWFSGKWCEELLSFIYLKKLERFCISECPVSQFTYAGTGRLAFRIQRCANGLSSWYPSVACWCSLCWKMPFVSSQVWS